MIIPYPCMDSPVALVIFDIDGVVRDVSRSYRRAIADTVEAFTQNQYRPEMADIDTLKSEGIWNNDWKASEELIYRHFESMGVLRSDRPLDYDSIVAFFQSRYRGDNYDGYIKDEPLLMGLPYLENLSKHQIGWGFFSGATQGSARFVLEHRIGILHPVLVAMEDAPGKPDPTGLFQSIDLIQAKLEQANPTHNFDWSAVPVFYVGDTVADLQTALNAREKRRDRMYYPLGILPPHARNNKAYEQQLRAKNALEVLSHVEDLSPQLIQDLLKKCEIQK